MPTLTKEKQEESIGIVIQATEISESKETKTTSKPMDEFCNCLVQSIDEALCSLGEPVKNTIYQNLCDIYKINKENLPQNIAEFSKFIQKIGCGGIEFKIIKNLNAKLKAKKFHSDVEVSIWMLRQTSFVEYVSNLRGEYESHCNY